jgi:hypothetical protein
MAFAVKLGILVVKAVTKPFAKRIKNTEDIRLQKLCKDVGQFQNKMMTLVNLRMSGIKAKKVKPLADEQALVLGSELVSEGVILGVSGVLLGFEYWRREVIAEKKKKKLMKEKNARRNEKMLALEAKFKPLQEKLEQLENEIKILKSQQEKKKINVNNNNNNNSWTSWFIFEKG